MSSVRVAIEGTYNKRERKDGKGQLLPISGYTLRYIGGLALTHFFVSQVPVADVLLAILSPGVPLQFLRKGIHCSKTEPSRSQGPFQIGRCLFLAFRTLQHVILLFF